MMPDMTRNFRNLSFQVWGRCEVNDAAHKPAMSNSIILAVPARFLDSENIVDGDSLEMPIFSAEFTAFSEMESCFARLAPVKPVMQDGMGITVMVRNRTSVADSHCRVPGAWLRVLRARKMQAMLSTAATRDIVNGNIPPPRKAIETRVAESRRAISINVP